MPPQRRKGSIGGGLGRNPLADEAEHTPPVSPLRDAKWPRTPQLSPAATSVLMAPAKSAKPATRHAPLVTSAPPIDATPTPSVDPTPAAAARVDPTPAPAAPLTPPVAETPAPGVLDLPIPAAGGDGPLSHPELEQLELCESSIDALRVAFWTAGRALQIVRDGRLYRAGHSSFDEYVEKRWDMQRSYAHKLIRAWPLAARLHPVAPTINEGQIRELLPIAAAHGEDAAVTVYTTLAADAKVTAGRLREALAVLPKQYDEPEVVRRLQAWLRGDLADDDHPRGGDLFRNVESRLAALTQKVVKGSGEDPAAAREFAAKLRTFAELIEQQLPATARGADTE
ncbi:hypothetical protein [Nocardia sp. NBC_00511]|uniref:hypothetical protein n=1 Tax=Nocardia sp. NBC_00511 TaxID=2903591 RepID=UPI0030DF3B99